MTYDEVTGTGRNRIPFSQVPIDRATAYAAEDADVALRLWQTLRPRLRFNGGAKVVLSSVTHWGTVIDISPGAMVRVGSRQ